MELGCRVLAGLLVLLGLWGLSAAEPVKFKDCGSESGNLTTVDITACTSLPCQLHKGKTYGVNVTFVSFTASETSKAVVHGIMAGVPLPFTLPNDDGCKSGIQCPIRKGQQYNYINSLAIKEEYPSVKLVVQWQLKDDKSRDIFCWEIPVEISS
ncbi:NPC intracellular cholesterol transporter 2-like [Pristis pectinata]|uniref:NPC intracellular cholesterol transporter 2-like n=1 Tax=Pristis pectinata TaxID=685728 RepID=UPI00223CADBD|nr:NPC intracellular cholesterol transporter 2-like [Pristis pectinata]